MWNSLSSLLLFHSYVFLQWKRCLCWLPPLGTCAGASCRWGKFTSNPTLKQFSVHDGVQLLCKWCYILGSKLQICVSSLAPDYKGHKINVHLHCSVICTHQFRVEVWYLRGHLSHSLVFLFFFIFLYPETLNYSKFSTKKCQITKRNSQADCRMVFEMRKQ